MLAFELSSAASVAAAAGSLGGGGGERSHSLAVINGWVNGVCCVSLHGNRLHLLCIQDAK